MALVPSYAQTVPSPAQPLVDPQTGRITEAWLQFMLSLSTRTGGAPGPALDLGTLAAAGTTTGAQVLAILADVPDPAPSLAPLTAGQAALSAAVTDLQTLAALQDVREPAGPDEAALLALVLDD